MKNLNLIYCNTFRLLFVFIRPSIKNVHQTEYCILRMLCGIANNHSTGYSKTTFTEFGLSTFNHLMALHSSAHICNAQ